MLVRGVALQISSLDVFLVYASLFGFCAPCIGAFLNSLPIAVFFNTLLGQGDCHPVYENGFPNNEKPFPDSKPGADCRQGVALKTGVKRVM